MKAFALSLCLAAGCAQLSAVDGAADGGAAGAGAVSVEPPAGTVSADAKFTVTFGAAMNPADLLAADQRSDQVVLAADAVAERAVAAIERGRLTAADRALLVPATASIGADAKSLTLRPVAPLPAGPLDLLVSSRLRDAAGRKVSPGARFRYEVGPGTPAPSAQLVDPPPGWQPPANLAAVRAVASGAVSLVDGQGLAVAPPVAADGGVELRLCPPAQRCSALAPGAEYRLAVAGAPLADASFTTAACERTAPPAFSAEGVVAQADETSATVHAVLDWPGQLVVALEADGADGGACAGEACAARVRVACTPPACGPQAFVCPAELSLSGLQPDRTYVLAVHAEDDEGFVSAPVRVPVATLAAQPRPMLAEIMASPAGPSPASAGEYIEILNAGTGALDVSALGLSGPDGIVRPLLGEPPPLPVLLAPGERALAVGLGFEAARYPSLPRHVPVLRAKTKKLLSRGLPAAPPPLRLVALAAPAQTLSSYPGGTLRCPRGTSLQRDESVLAETASWACGTPGGTPGRPP